MSKKLDENIVPANHLSKSSTLRTKPDVTKYSDSSSEEEEDLSVYSDHIDNKFDI
jgi:hypothetical protein